LGQKLAPSSPRITATLVVRRLVYDVQDQDTLARTANTHTDDPPATVIRVFGGFRRQ